MKNILLIAVLFIISCKDKKPEPTTPEVCTLGIDSTEYATNLRVFKEDSTAESVAARGKPIKPPKPVPPINPDNPDQWPVIYVDTDGDTVRGTMWNYQNEIICAPASLDSTGIRLVMENVIEDFAPWQVRVTNVEAVFLAAPITKRQKIILTASTPFGLSAGQAMLNSFGSGDPAFVFTVCNVTIKKNKEATSHETGHTLGLRHQDKCDGSYAMGIIMGNGYYVDKPWWHDSPCQKDMIVIDKKLVRK